MNDVAFSILKFSLAILMKLQAVSNKGLVCSEYSFPSLWFSLKIVSFSSIITKAIKDCSFIYLFYLNFIIASHLPLFQPTYLPKNPGNGGSLHQWWIHTNLQNIERVCGMEKLGLSTVSSKNQFMIEFIASHLVNSGHSTWMLEYQL